MNAWLVSCDIKADSTNRTQLLYDSIPNSIEMFYLNHIETYEKLHANAILGRQNTSCDDEIG